MKFLTTDSGSPTFLNVRDAFVELSKFALEQSEKIVPGSTAGILEVRICPGSPSAELVSFSEDGSILTVYPENALPGERYDSCFYRKIGKRLWGRISESKRTTWRNLLYRLPPASADRICEGIKPEQSFKDSVEAFPEAVEKLAAVHITNALAANSFTPSAVQHLSPKAVPACQGLLSGKIPFSLIPLVSSYGSVDYLDFCCYFSLAVLTEEKVFLAEESVARALKSVFKNVTKDD